MSIVAEPTETATQAIMEAANEWLLRMQDDAPEYDQVAFVAWLRESPVHVREYLRAETVWLALEGVDSHRRIDVEALLEIDDSNVVELIESPRGKATSPPGPASRRWTKFAAAGLATLAIAFGGYWYSIPPEPVRYSTGLGEQRRLVLDDGSVVEMNTQSELSVILSEERRSIRLLQGEALFTVARDPDRPFVVDSEHAVVRALGTQFNVYRQADRTLVTVLEGRVAVENTDTPLLTGSGAVGAVAESVVELVAGDGAAIPSSAPIERIAPNPDKAIAWTKRRLVFEDETLAAVAAEFNRYNSRQLLIGSDSLGQQRISAVFDADQPESLVRFLEQDSSIVVVEKTQLRLVIQLSE